MGGRRRRRYFAVIPSRRYRSTRVNRTKGRYFEFENVINVRRKDRKRPKSMSPNCPSSVPYEESVFISIMRYFVRYCHKSVMYATGAPSSTCMWSVHIVTFFHIFEQDIPIPDETLLSLIAPASLIAFSLLPELQCGARFEYSSG